MRLVWIALVVACGSSKPASKPAPVKPEPAPSAPIASPEPTEPTIPQSFDATPQPAPAPPPPAQDLSSFLARLRDDGPVLGVPGYVQKQSLDTKHCRGVRVSITRGKRTLTEDEDAVAAMYRIEFPTGLDFDPDPKHKARKDASMKKFGDWLAHAQQVGKKSTDLLQTKLAAATDEATKAEYTARIALVSLRFAALIARGEIPRDVRTGEFAQEKMAAFCDKMLEVAGPLLERAEAAFETCRTAAASSPTAWWAKACAAP